MKSPREVIDRIMLDWRSATHSAFPAQISAYDAALGTVDVVPGIQREVPTDNPTEPWALEKLPLLYNVPVMWPRGGGFAMTFPLRAGDWVLVVCAEQSTLLWRQTGLTHEAPGLIDPFGLNGLVALPGWFPDSAKLQGVSSSELVIGTEDGTTALRMNANGTVRVGDADTSVHLKTDGTVHVGADGVPLALAPLVDALLDGLATQIAAVIPGTGQAAVAIKAIQAAFAIWAGTTSSVGAKKAMGV